MAEEFYVRNKGWHPSPHGLGTYQESYYDDVLASRTDCGDGTFVYTLYTHNIHGTRYLDRIVTGVAKAVHFHGVYDEKVAHKNIQKIFDRLKLETVTVIDFTEPPKLKTVQCNGYLENGCSRQARFWCVPMIDGNTAVRSPMCVEHATECTNDFNDCPVYPNPKPI